MESVLMHPAALDDYWLSQSTGLPRVLLLGSGNMVGQWRKMQWLLLRRDMQWKMMLQAACDEGKQLVRTEILTENTIKIGKLSSSHVRIDDEQVSRMHAVVEVNGPQEVFILDLGSTTGTFVNGERVTKQRLQSNDRVELGSVTVVVTIAGQRKGGAAGEGLPIFRRAIPLMTCFCQERQEASWCQRKPKIGSCG